MTDFGPRVLVVNADGRGSRIDAWLAGALQLSRTRIATLIQEGRVCLNGSVPPKSEALCEGDRIEVELPPTRQSDAVPESIPVDIVYEDEHLLVVDKPAGMVVHPAPGHRSGTMVNALLFHVRSLSGVGGAIRPGIVHRLDQDTSGLLVVAKEDKTHHALSSALRRREVRRLYVAAAWGHLSETHVRVDQPIGRDPRDRKRMGVVGGGRRAVTRIRVKARWRSAELLDVALETGRTHQIRVHLAHLGHPVLGDGVYGEGWERGMGGPNRGWARELARRTPRQFLHAARLGFEHPVTGESMQFRSPLPDDLEAIVRWAEASDLEAEEGPP
jgi:23S rRNA pseudouridine1911/1915/1917 synthase